MVFAEEELGQIGAVLSSDAGDEATLSDMRGLIVRYLLLSSPIFGSNCKCSA
jgi:hypothetical protein